MKFFLAAVFVAALSTGTVAADTLKVFGGNDPRLSYFAAVLEEGFQAGGRPVRIERIALMPQPRALAALDDGTLSAVPAQRTPERDRRWIAVPVGITGGLLGRRILLIRPGDEARFAGVRTLADFRATGAVGGFGAGWRDLAVWQANGLAVTEVPGDWSVLFAMLAAGNRGVDYFSRGAFEVAAEAPAHPGLAVEQTLLLDYDGDFVFYLTPSLQALAPALTAGLTRMTGSGRIAALITQHFGPDLENLGLDRRMTIRLATPAQ